MSSQHALEARVRRAIYACGTRVQGSPFFELWTKAAEDLLSNEANLTNKQRKDLEWAFNRAVRDMQNYERAARWGMA